MKYQARGALVNALLNSSAGAQFEFLLENTAEDRSAKGLEDKPVMSRAGGLLLQYSGDEEFCIELAKRLLGSLNAIFWVELSEHLIRDTTCRFRAFGEFRRFASNLSFLPERLWEQRVLPTIVPDSTPDYALDALCRSVQETARHDARTTFKSRLRTGIALTWQDFSTELLRQQLPRILSVLKPPAPYVASVFSSAAALASYYAWVIAFDAAVQSAVLPVPGVGNFRFVAGPAVNRIDFTVEEAFSKLIEINAEKPPLPDQVTPTGEAAA